jgi:O-antigen ligase
MNDTNLQHTEPQSARVTRTWISLLTQINLTQLKKHFLAISYTLFFLGFFFFPSRKSHSNFFYIAVALPFLILIFMKKVPLRSFFSSRTFLLSTIFLVYMFSTLLWADNCDLSDISKYGRRVLYILIFLGVTIHLVQTYPNFLQRLLVALCWTAAIFAVGYIVFYYRQHPFPLRIYGFGQLHNPIMASSVYGIAFIACIYLFQQQHTMKTKLLYLGMLSVLFSYMMLAQSRGPLLALGVTIFGWPILESFSRKEGDHSHRNNFFLILLMISTALVVLFMLYPDFFKSRLFRGIPYRLDIWGQSLSQAKDALFFGHGLTADTRLIMPDGTKMLHHHSVYMTTLFYGGIVGGLLLSALAGSAIWQGLTRTGKPQKFLITCMLLFGTLCMVTDGNTLIRHPKPVWLFFWFPIALVAASELSGNPLGGEKRTDRTISSPA